jgi:drug/metabolite transporter (DMT)-like permease
VHYVILAIISGLSLGLIFKLWSHWEIRVLPAILHNYIACVLTAWLLHGAFPLSSSNWNSPWFPYAAGLSLFFVLGFYLFGLAVWYWGVAIMTALQKMSMVLSTVFVVIVFHENLAPAQWTGLGLGILAIPLVMSGKTPGRLSDLSRSHRAYLVAGASLLMAAVIEAGLVYLERVLALSSADPQIIAVIFGLAFCWGSLVLIANGEQRRAFFQVRQLAAGWLLGIPNYLSIHFLMKAIGSSFPLGLVFPVINIATILLGVLLGISIFREPLDVRMRLGLFLALVSLLLMALTTTTHE